MNTDAAALSIHEQEQGWTRRFTALGPRLKEAVEMYAQLGFEVKLEAADLAESDEENLPRAEGCKHCIVTTLARTIYTRPRRLVDGGTGDGGLCW